MSVLLGVVFLTGCDVDFIGFTDVGQFHRADFAGSVLDFVDKIKDGLVIAIKATYVSHALHQYCWASLPVVPRLTTSALSQ